MQKFRRVFEGIAKAGQSTDLNDFYTELFITERVSGEVNKEHEVRLIETASRNLAKEETPIKLEDIFKPLPGQDQPRRTIMTTGVAGIGKTILTHKFTLDWAEGKANHDIHFTLPFTFRELNLLKEKEFSLMELLHHFFIQIKGIRRYDLFQVVFILDGLDECRLPLDFKKNPIWTDVTKSTSVDVLLTNLIRGDLLPSARIWITTRPAAANQIPAECIGMVTEKLSRRHALRLSPAAQVSVEECSLAVGEKVGYRSIKIAARMNRAVVVFLDNIYKVNSVVESRVAIRDVFTQVMPLFNSARRVMISNAPPFLSNEALGRELGRYGLLVSPIRMVSLGCKSPHLKHVLSFRRNTFMILKNNEADLDLVMKFKVENFDYTVFATTENQKCFKCGLEGHFSRLCPQLKEGAGVAGAVAPLSAAVPVAGPPVAAAEPPVAAAEPPVAAAVPPVAAAVPPVAAAVPVAEPPVAAVVAAAEPPAAAAVPAVAAAMPPVAASVPVAGPLVDIAVASAVVAVLPVGASGRPLWATVTVFGGAVGVPPAVAGAGAPPAGALDAVEWPLAVPALGRNEVAQEMVEEREVGMVIGDESSKPSGKRKNLTEEKNKSKAKKVVSSSSDESEDESMSDYGTKDDTEYSFECIKSFLDKSKGRKVKIGKHFSN
ncbi:hypothetical protein NHX12_016183 [Muraenolepis orangiensis]|uniref:CCHC-type domain-containing protein n=1 Tax=Muraenolepis orangiensis TaxID=630683 RepID=A0A9Q0I1A7_9TELE|nr:hypothetical protein NHX12_016183 [Muraenolepis orangiensis]